MPSCAVAKDMKRKISTDLNALIIPGQRDNIHAALRDGLSSHGYEVTSIVIDPIDLTCEPDNMLVTQYAQVEGHPPSVEQLYRIVLTGYSTLDLRAATKVVVGLLPHDIYWYGTSVEGHIDTATAAACAWQPDAD
ncbi:hypothetical protein CULCOIPH002_15860 [Corynebacterium ulcerans]|uniref:Uncharacterized protein n=2 Tax=Corynebacterium ulcerans TaxID=65058 RepID=A0ABD0BM47_CORUL|nr:hypothetical protein CULC0102_1558 [Corynebacterium ulcerans 0102]BBJ72400.1 hypothetical protein CULC0211_15340 [Corynebacterium ulcerans]BBJ74705.1 hypothetical protein CULCFH20161_15320 [Corynebacterium ulcerans]GJJ33789.1 hypothetical protein CULCOIPH001_09970 [Corynebacterium ulcerans]GJJ36674.1 hypothetical protein CULCOIPH002_15860 [Corynebacterium ulcerans]